MSPYPHLFTPLALRGKELKNRVVTTPHATGWELPGGLISDSEIEYLIRKAAGGVGLVMTFGSATVDPTTAASYGSIALWDERNEPALRRIADGVHEHGALVISQATHMGHRGSSKHSLHPVRGVSDLPEPEHRETAVALRADELRTLVDRFVDVALRLERCGWDGIEITSFAHLIGQFWNPAINTRTDEYGGSLENRMRFGLEVVSAVRAAVGDRFIVGFRMSLEAMSGSRDYEPDADELLEIARRMGTSGAIDLLSVTVGDAMTKRALSVAMGSDFVPEAPAAEVAARVRAAVEVPVLMAGRVLTGERAERLLAEGAADLIGMTRAIIADPDLPEKLRAGGAVRRCIGINQGCIGRLYSGFPIVCSVNPAIRDPRLERLEPSASPGRVVVVGAGVAGLEAARHAAARGHRVTVLERAARVGGRARLNAEHGWRPSWQHHLDWLEQECRSLGIDLRLGVDADTDSVLSLEPRTVVIATGSSLRPVVAAPRGTRVIDADAAVSEPPPGPGTALLIDDEGGMTAATAAGALASQGWRVIVATPLPSIAGAVDATLIRFVHERLADAELEVIPDCRYLETDGADVVLEHVLTARTRRIPRPGLVVVAGHRRAENDLAARLRASAPGLDVRLAGDAHAPRDYDAATGEGALIGAAID